VSVDEVLDRRVRRSRAALFRAAVELVGEQGTSNVAVSELAAAADVSRQLVYQQFGDRDTLLLEAALDLARRELTARITLDPELPARITLDPELPARITPNRELTARITLDRERGDPRMAGTLEHFAQYRSFYRAMFTGPCAYRLTIALSELLSPFNRELVRGRGLGDLPDDVVDDLTTFFTGGWAAVINDWIINGPEPLEIEPFAERLWKLLAAITPETR
jgi:AcrR family transcriptional regulator